MTRSARTTGGSSTVTRVEVHTDKSYIRMHVSVYRNHDNFFLDARDPWGRLYQYEKASTCIGVAQRLARRGDGVMQIRVIKLS